MAEVLIDCLYCNGTGVDNDGIGLRPSSCGYCNGAGQVEAQTEEPLPDGYRTVRVSDKVADYLEKHPDFDFTTSPATPRRKANYVGAPAIWKLETYACELNRAFDGFGCYLVGSATERPDWRDVDVRMIMSDEKFDALFPGQSKHCRWEMDPRWLLLCSAISEQATRVTGLPIDFQIQPQTHANERHGNPGRGGQGTHRHALGMNYAWRPCDEDEIPDEEDEDKLTYARAGFTSGWEDMVVWDLDKNEQVKEVYSVDTSLGQALVYTDTCMDQLSILQGRFEIRSRVEENPAAPSRYDGRRS